MSKQPNVSHGSGTPPSLTSLYDLIHSLTQYQKRDFKKYASFWGSKESTKYLRLFDIVNHYVLSGKQKQDLMAHILKFEDFASKPGVSALSAYLFSKILESVRSTPEISPRTNRLHSLLQDIKFLYNKGLNEECYALIQDAMQLAREIDKSTYLLELYIWERRVLLSVRGVEQMAKRVGEMLAEEQKLVQNIQTFFALNTLNNDLFLSLKQGLPLSDFAQSKINEFLQHDQQVYLQSLTLRAKYWYLNSLYYYYEILHKQSGGRAGEEGEFPYLQKALTCLDAIIHIAETEGKILVSEEQSFYNALIDNYLNLCIRLGEFDRVRHIEESLTSERNETQLLRSAAFHRLTELIRDNNPAAAAAYIADNDLNKRLQEHGNNIGESRLSVIRYTCGQAYFILEDFDKASDWFAQIIDAPGSKANPNLLLVSEVHRIICLFELHAYQNDPFRPINNFLERLRRNNKANEFLDLLFAAIKNTFGQKNQDSDALIDALTEKTNQNSTLRTNFGLVLAWMEARFNGTTVAEEIVKYNRK